MGEAHTLRWASSFNSSMKKYILISVAALTLAACHHKGLPEGVMDAEHMAAFLADAYLVESFYAIETQYRYDVLTESALRGYDSILEVHGLTREQVERSFDYYSQHPDVYQSIQDSAAARLEADRDKLPASQSVAKPMGNSISSDSLLRRSIPMLGR